jgi:hypothetical protein
VVAKCRGDKYIRTYAYLINKYDILATHHLMTHTR